MRSSGKSVLAAAALAAAGVGMASEATRHVFRGYGKFANSSVPRPSKRYPSMVVSSREEIAEWNRNVQTRQVLRYQARHA